MPLEWKNLSSLLTHPAMAKVVVMANLTVLVLLSHALAGLTWRFVPAPPAVAPPPALLMGKRQPASSHRAAQTPVQEVAGWHLFGRVSAQAQAAAVPAQAALPETKLNLMLRGVLAIDDKRRAQAIIAQPNGDEQPYGIGDSLPGGAVLKEIRPTSVVLLRNGQFETLSLPKEELDGHQTVAPLAQAGAPVPSLREVRNKLLTDPESLSGLIQTQPYRGAQGQLMGFRVEPGQNKALFQHYGLQPGDIVTSINGVALNSASNAFQILRGLSSRDDVDIELIRNGSRQSLNLHIQ